MDDEIKKLIEEIRSDVAEHNERGPGAEVRPELLARLLRVSWLMIPLDLLEVFEDDLADVAAEVSLYALGACNEVLGEEP